jgi:hypothetical protein
MVEWQTGSRGVIPAARPEHTDCWRQHGMSTTDHSTQVEYRQVSGYSNYRVGSDGTVQSTFANGLLGGRVSWRPLARQKHTGGYLIVHFYKDKKRKPMYVHRLVLEAFVGPCPEGMEACHNNGDRGDNRVENLRWDTRKGNFADKVDHGTLLEGSQVGNSKLHEVNINPIRRLAEMGVYQWQIAEAFGVEQSLVSQIVRGRIWDHVE